MSQAIQDLLLGAQFTREHPDPDAPIHLSEAGGWLPCCSRNVLELHPWRNRVTTDPALVTCTGEGLTRA